MASKGFVPSQQAARRLDATTETRNLAVTRLGDGRGPFVFIGGGACRSSSPWPPLIGGITFLVWRAHYAVQTVKAAKEVDRHTGIGRHARNAGLVVFGTRLTRVNDPRLAAVILMLQLVRTGAPVTAAEKTQIMELMENPLQISNIETIFVRAWSYTEANRVFSRIADELVPMLRDKLAVDERLQLVDMLRTVANAYGEASELQTEAINRLKRRLTMPDPSFVSPIEKPFGD